MRNVCCPLALIVVSVVTVSCGQAPTASEAVSSTPTVPDYLIVSDSLTLPNVLSSNETIEIEWTSIEDNVRLESSDDGKVTWSEVLTVDGSSGVLILTLSAYDLPEGEIHLRLAVRDQTDELGTVIVDDTPPTFASSTAIIASCITTGTYSFTLPEIASDENGEPSYTLVIAPALGTISGCADGTDATSCQFDSAVDGSVIADEFVYRAVDAAGNTSETVTVSIYRGCS